MKIKDVTLHFPDWTISGFGKIHFADIYQILYEEDRNYSVDHLTRMCLSYNPGWVRWLIKNRNTIVGFFGLKTDMTDRKTEVLYFEKGSVLIYFHVLERNEDTIVLEEKDKHLDFRILARVSKAEEYGTMAFQISTLVHFNNIFGRIYFAIIKPFHFLIMNAMKNHLKTLEKDTFNDPYLNMRVFPE